MYFLYLGVGGILSDISKDGRIEKRPEGVLQEEREGGREGDATSNFLIRLIRKREPMQL